MYDFLIVNLHGSAYFQHLLLKCYQFLGAKLIMTVDFLLCSGCVFKVQLYLALSSYIIFSKVNDVLACIS